MSVGFEGLNLRRNPFGALTAEEATALAVFDPGDLPAWLAVPGRALQLVGPPGSGKTTRLRALHARLPGARWLRPAEEDGALEAVPTDATLLLVDDAQRLPARALAALLHRGRSLALTTHADLLRRCGLDVRTEQVRGLSAAELEEAIARRIERVRRGPGPVPGFTRAEVAALLAAHGADVRAILGALYDRLQERADAA